ncbi:hypothetical protein [Nocardia sp. NPDC048505]|uniref:hypothetical protein n=1 Tax=unclassified Nocardia TaxID=2637762 RepID=UPI0033D07D9E
MGSIDDWYQNRAHRGDLDPRYDFASDDRPDRLQFGELPQREWMVRPEKRGPRKQPVATAAKRKPSARKTKAHRRTRAERARPPWELFVRSWLHKHPNAGNSQCRAAAQRAGFPIDKKAVASVRRALAAERAAKPTQGRDRGPQRLDEQARIARQIEQNRAAARLQRQQAAAVVAEERATEQRLAFIRDWLARHPSALDSACHEAAHRSGLHAVTMNMIARVRRGMDLQPQAGKTAAVGKARRNRARPALAGPTSPPETGTRCPACDMVPDAVTGHCRCS